MLRHNEAFKIFIEFWFPLTRVTVYALIVRDRSTLVSFPVERRGRVCRFLRRRSRITISRLHTCTSSGITEVIVLARSCYGIPVPSSSFGQISCMIAPEFVRRGHVDTFLLVHDRLQCILMILVNYSRRYDVIDSHITPGNALDTSILLDHPSIVQQL